METSYGGLAQQRWGGSKLYDYHHSIGMGIGIALSIGRTNEDC